MTRTLFDQTNPPAPAPVAPRDTVRYQRGSDTSRAGAVHAMETGKSQVQLNQYLTALFKAGDAGLTDHEAAEILGIPVTSINARRNCKHAQQYVTKSDDRRRGPTGVANVVWKHNRAPGVKA